MKKLDFSGLFVTDEHMHKILENNSHSLTNLCLNNCALLTDATLRSIEQNCKALKTLELGELYHLTADSLRDLLSDGKCVKSLELVSLRRNDVTDEVVIALAASCGKYLQNLDLNSCTNLTNVAIGAITKYCRQTLRTIDLSFCRKITNEALGYMADECALLREVSLWGCTQVNDVFLCGHSRFGLKVIGRENKE